MADEAALAPIYSPFFGVMGAAAAIIFSGKFPCKNLEEKKMECRRKICDLGKIKISLVDKKT
jgi:hypothetical protein